MRRRNGRVSAPCGQTTTREVEITQTGTAAPHDLVTRGQFGSGAGELIGFLNSNGLVTLHGTFRKGNGWMRAVHAA